MKSRKYLIAALIIFIILTALFFIIFILYNNSSNNPDEDWNKVDNGSKYDSDSLYDSESVIELDKVFKNLNFITQVKTNRLSYFYGFTDDGNYLALINYDDKIKSGYVLNIINIITDETLFSIFIPDGEAMLDSKEFIFAKELVKNAYEITIPVDKLDWDETLTYKNDQGIWNFKEVVEDKESTFTISTSENDEIWEILLNNELGSLVYTEVFAPTIYNDILTFVFYFDQFQTGITKYEIITIDTKKLTDKNSVKGKVDEADKWLYGEFAFIYDQWKEHNKKGFIAISHDKRGAAEREDMFYQQIDQWVYMDMTGKMQWYGNSEGIFNNVGEPIELAESSYYYDLNVIEYYGKGLTYYVVDMYNNTNKGFVKTVEFIWDMNKQYMVPIKDKDVVIKSNLD